VQLSPFGGQLFRFASLFCGRNPIRKGAQKTGGTAGAERGRSGRPSGTATSGGGGAQPTDAVRENTRNRTEGDQFPMRSVEQSLSRVHVSAAGCM
jgi:hypothetical protein